MSWDTFLKFWSKLQKLLSLGTDQVPRTVEGAAGLSSEIPAGELGPFLTLTPQLREKVQLSNEIGDLAEYLMALTPTRDPSTRLQKVASLAVNGNQHALEFIKRFEHDLAKSMPGCLWLAAAYKSAYETQDFKVELILTAILHLVSAGRKGDTRAKETVREWLNELSPEKMSELAAIFERAGIPFPRNSDSG